MIRRPRVLIGAYACNPYQGSEEGVGWNWVRCVASFCEADVIVAGYHRADIERYQREHPEELNNVRFRYVRERPWHFRPTPFWKRIENSVAKPLMNLSYARWQKDAYPLAQRLHAEHRFDLAHQITYVGYRFPGRLWQLDIPFVWGPVGGLDCLPTHLLPLLGLSGAVYYAGRNTINALQKRFLTSSKRAFRTASAVIAATSEMRDEIRKWYGVNSEVICEVGPPPVPDCPITRRRPDEPLQICWSGLHLPGKALPLLLNAVAASSREQHRRPRSLMPRQ